MENEEEIEYIYQLLKITDQTIRDTETVAWLLQQNRWKAAVIGKHITPTHTNTHANSLL